jgi:hypothetical protein
MLMKNFPSTTTSATTTEEPDVNTIIADLKALVRRQSICDVRKLGWDRVCEVRVHPDAFAQLTADLPRYEGPTPFVNIRVTVDRWLRPGMIVPLDEKGEVVVVGRLDNLENS